jgi:hypothetical protein
MAEGMTEIERQEMNEGFKSLNGKVETLTGIINQLATQFAVLDAFLFGKNKDNGINGQTKKNTEAIEKLDNRIDVIEKQKTVSTDVKPDNKFESKKLTLEWWKAIIIAILIFLGSGTGSFIMGKLWP